MVHRSRMPTPPRRCATRSGEVVLSDGPFVESAEMIGGYYDVELPDLDVAIEAAALLPPAYAVEIRAVIELDDSGEQVG